jgi:hypothetical protein
MRTMIDMNGLLPGFSYGGMPYDMAERSLRLFADKVLPELKSWETTPLQMPTAVGLPT